MFRFFFVVFFITIRADTESSDFTLTVSNAESSNIGVVAKPNEIKYYKFKEREWINIQCNVHHDSGPLFGAGEIVLHIRCDDERIIARRITIQDTLKSRNYLGPNLCPNYSYGEIVCCYGGRDINFIARVVLQLETEIGTLPELRIRNSNGLDVRNFRNGEPLDITCLGSHSSKKVIKIQPLDEIFKPPVILNSNMNEDKNGTVKLKSYIMNYTDPAVFIICDIIDNASDHIINRLQHTLIRTEGLDIFGENEWKEEMMYSIGNYSTPRDSFPWDTTLGEKESEARYRSNKTKSARRDSSTRRSTTLESEVIYPIGNNLTRNSSVWRDTSIGKNETERIFPNQTYSTPRDSTWRATTIGEKESEAIYPIPTSSTRPVTSSWRDTIREHELIEEESYSSESHSWRDSVIIFIFMTIALVLAIIFGGVACCLFKAKRNKMEYPGHVYECVIYNSRDPVPTTPPMEAATALRQNGDSKDSEKYVTMTPGETPSVVHYLDPVQLRTAKKKLLQQDNHVINDSERLITKSSNRSDVMVGFDNPINHVPSESDRYLLMKPTNHSAVKVTDYEYTNNHVSSESNSYLSIESSKPSAAVVTEYDYTNNHVSSESDSYLTMNPIKPSAAVVTEYDYTTSYPDAVDYLSECAKGESTASPPSDVKVPEVIYENCSQDPENNFVEESTYETI